MVAKPESVSSDAFKSAKWDELTAGRDFAASDVPALTLLCQWYAVVERCMKRAARGACACETGRPGPRRTPFGAARGEKGRAGDCRGRARKNGLF